MARPVALASLYLHAPLGRARQVRLRGVAPGEARLDLDQNECKLGAFGEITFTTQMDYLSLKVDLRAAGEIDLPHRGRLHAYDVVVIGMFAPPDAPGGAPAAQSLDEARERLRLLSLEGKSFRLVLGDPPCGAARLVLLDADGGVDRVIGLERSE